MPIADVDIAMMIIYLNIFCRITNNKLLYSHKNHIKLLKGGRTVTPYTISTVAQNMDGMMELVDEREKMSAA